MINILAAMLLLFDNLSYFLSISPSILAGYMKGFKSAMGMKF